MDMSRFVIRKVPSGLKFDLYAANGKAILTSEVYTTAHACRKGLESVRKNAPLAKLEDQTDGNYVNLTNPKFQLYRDKSGDYRFRLRGRNGQIIGISENYNARAGALGGIESVRKNAPDAGVEEFNSSP